jgi:hypothetical protein
MEENDLPVSVCRGGFVLRSISELDAERGMYRNRERKLSEATVTGHHHGTLYVDVYTDIASGLVNQDADCQVRIKYLRILKTAKELSSSVPAERCPPGRQTV